MEHYNNTRSVTILVPYKGPGNTIMQKDVSFDVYNNFVEFKAVPLLTASEKRLANLPDELLFSIENGEAISKKGKYDGNFHVIKDIVCKIENDQQK